LLLQIGFHAQIARERGDFDFNDVAQSIVDKLERRYPTILGDEPNTLKTPEEIDRRWEEIKAQERAAKGSGETDASILDEISHALPALLRSAKLKGRAAKAGWEWPDVTMLLDKISEEVGELQAEIAAEKADKEKVAAELGDLMLMVDFARWNGIDAEDALRITNNRFERRFRYMEQGLKKLGKDIGNSSRDERLALWNEAKLAEKARK
jgi:ATP diphosphatase